MIAGRRADRQEAMLFRLFSKARTALRIARDMADPDIRRNANRAIRAYKMAPDFRCPCCGYRGRFDSFGDTLQFNEECPDCRSKTRHRLVALAHEEGFLSFAGRDILHLAPEPVLRRLVQFERPASYVTSDIEPGRADIVLDIERPHLRPVSFDLIICLHVLEHVAEGPALAGMRSLLRPGGEIILMVPLVEGWCQSYEDEAVETPEDRHRYFGQSDHLRYYGSDLRRRVRAAGFSLREFTPDGRTCGDIGLLPGETVFCARLNGS